MWAARSLFLLALLSVFLTSCTGAAYLPPGGQTLLLADSQYEVILLSNWRNPGEKRVTLTSAIDGEADFILINGGRSFLTLCSDGSWEIRKLKGGNLEKGDFRGKTWLALDYERDKAMVQMKEGDGFQYFLWDLKANQRKSWVPQFPNTFGKQREIEEYIALEKNIIAMVTQDPLGKYHLWCLSDKETKHLMELPGLILPDLESLPMGRLGRLTSPPLSISPDGRWIVMLAGFIPGMGTPYFIVDLQQGWRYLEFWPERFNAPPKHILWSPDSLHLLISSLKLDGSGTSFLFDLPPTRRERLDELAFWANEDWLLLYHTAPPGEVAYPPVQATLRSVRSGDEIKVDLSDYIEILDVLPRALGEPEDVHSRYQAVTWAWKRAGREKLQSRKIARLRSQNTSFFVLAGSQAGF